MKQNLYIYINTWNNCMSKFTTEFLFFYIYYIEVGIWNIEI